MHCLGVGLLGMQLLPNLSTGENCGNCREALEGHKRTCPIVSCLRIATGGMRHAWSLDRSPSARREGSSLRRVSGRVVENYRRLQMRTNDFSVADPDDNNATD